MLLLRAPKQGSAKLGNTFPEDTELWSPEGAANMAELHVHIACFNAARYLYSNPL